MYAEKVQTAEKSLTINDRLSQSLGTLEYQCERIESVLGRVNGTPQRLGAATGKDAPTPVSSMQNNAEKLEALVERVVSLAGAVERIA